MSLVEIGGPGVVLHQQCSAALHVVEKALVVLLDLVAGVIGANAQDDRSEAAQFVMCPRCRETRL